MRKSIIALVSVSVLGLGACNNSAADKVGASSDEAANNTVEASDVSTEGTPVFEFVEEVHDFGTIDEGTMAEYDFEFTNTGDAPLIITNAKGSCGCTVPNPPKEPIAPGETGKIHVSFNSNGRTGNQQKTVTLNANTVPNTKVLRITAQVTPKATEEGTPVAEEAAH